MVTFQDKSGYLFLFCFRFFLILQYYVYFVFICSENIIKFFVTTSPFLRSKYCKFITRWGSVSDFTQRVFTMLTTALAVFQEVYP